MVRKHKLPELLCPAGSMEALYAAVLGGADAVYVGGKRFGARAFAKNFDEAELIHAVEYCHLHAVKLYVTVNTLIYDKEMDEAVEYCGYLCSIGVDAVIVADPGLISRVREKYPTLELHASTQMGVHNSEGAELAYAMGLSRAVLARECSSSDIRAITENTSIEIEIFIHGALCVCHSGQCLFSSLVGGRSGNRGECAQPCRLPYGSGYPLSLNDLSLAAHIPEIIDLGVSSLKIEGRMKSPDYVYTVTKIFRALLDEKRAASPEEWGELESIFSRGFTDGYFVGRKGCPMTGRRTEEAKQMTDKLKVGIYSPFRAKVFGSAELRLGKAATMSLSLELYCREWDNQATVTASFVSDSLPTAAISQPLTKEGVKERLSKLGGTLFEPPACGFDIRLDEGINLPPSAVNALRRGAVDALLKKLRLPLRVLFGNAESEDCSAFGISSCRRESCPELRGGTYQPLHSDAAFNGRLHTAVFYKSSLLSSLLPEQQKMLSYFDILFVPLEGYASLSGSNLEIPIGVCVPAVVMESERASVLEMLRAASADGVKYALVSNIGGLGLVRDFGLIPIGDFRLNITNSDTKAVFLGLGLTRTLLSPELTLPQARDIGGGEIVLGKIPLMLTERCFIKDSFGCKRCDEASLTDRYGARFAMLSCFGHRNIIFNSIHTYMGDRKDELDKLGIFHRHFVFSDEKPAEALRLIEAYFSGASAPKGTRRIGKR